MLNQVSVFAENTKGALRKMTSVLADANINIYTMLANDSAEFGIIRLIVTNPELAVSKLQEAGYQCHMDKVVAVEMGDTPGCLDKILDSLRQANISIDYLYISYNRQASTPVAIFKTREMETFIMRFFSGIVLIAQRLHGKAVLPFVRSDGIFRMYLRSPGIISTYPHMTVVDV